MAQKLKDKCKALTDWNTRQMDATEKLVLESQDNQSVSEPRV